MIYIIWEFDVESSKMSAFEETYGSHGAWTILFQQSKNYHGTVLLKDHAKLGSYITIDQWDNLVDFENFKTQHIEAYNELDYQCENLTLAEKKIGIFDNI